MGIRGQDLHCALSDVAGLEASTPSQWVRRAATFVTEKYSGSNEGPPSSLPLIGDVATRGSTDPMNRRQDTRARSMFTQHSDFVARTLSTAGVPPSDVDDEVQRTFMV